MTTAAVIVAGGEGLRFYSDTSFDKERGTQCSNRYISNERRSQIDDGNWYDTSSQLKFDKERGMQCSNSYISNERRSQIDDGNWYHIPKQYTMLAGELVLSYSLQKFSKLVDNVIVVIRKEHEKLFKGMSGADYVFGGNRRQDSVYEGLKALQRLDPTYVLIHDAARPMVSSRIITDILEQLQRFKAVDVGLPVQDTIKQKTSKVTTLDREILYITQTPQGFHFKTILELYEKYNHHKDYTDDVSLAIESGIEVGLVQGDKNNIKITTSDDLSFCESVIHIARAAKKQP